MQGIIQLAHKIAGQGFDDVTEEDIQELLDSLEKDLSLEDLHELVC